MASPVQDLFGDPSDNDASLTSAAAAAKAGKTAAPDTGKITLPPDATAGTETEVFRRKADKIISAQEKETAEVSKIPDPKPPQMKTAPKQSDYQTDPMQTWGSPAMWMATLGSLMTRRPLTAALNASAGVMNAANQRDAKAYESASETWKMENDNAFKQAQWELDGYKAVLEKHKNNEETRNHEMEWLAKRNGDPTMEAMVKSGQYKEHMAAAEKNIAEANKATNENNFSIKYTNDLLRAAKVKKGGDLSPTEADQIFLKANTDISDMKKGKDEGQDNLEFRDKLMTDLTEDYKKNHKGQEPTGLVADKLRLKANSMIVGSGKGKDADAGVLTDEQYESLKKSPAVINAERAFHSGAPLVSVAPGRGDRNVFREAVQRLNGELHPDDNWEANNASLLETKKEQASNAGRTVNAKTAVKEMDKLADPMIAAVKKIDPVAYPTFNDLKIAFEGGTGDPDVKKAYMAVQAYKTAYQGILQKNGVATDEVRKTSDSVVNLDFALSQIEGVRDQGIIEGAAVIDALNDVNKELQDKIKGGTSDAKNTAPDAAHIDVLKSDPSDLKRAQFDYAYGKGAAAKILGD